MKLFGALLLVALVALPYYANASLADRVVPEQFYDATTEAHLGTEQGQHQTIRDTGTTQTDNDFEAIEALLATLTANITAERGACVTKNAEDTASCESTQATAAAACQQTYDDTYNPLVDNEATTRDAKDKALSAKTAAVEVYDAQFDTHQDVANRLAQALKSLAELVARAATNNDVCQLAATASFDRAIAYITEAHATNKAYLTAAGDMVTQIEKMVAELQADSSNVDGVGSQYALIQKLPMAQRAQLNLLAIKYISTNRTLDASTDLTTLFSDLRASIATQTEAEQDAWAEDIKLAGAQRDAENDRCDAEQERAVDSMTTEKEVLEIEELKQRTQLAGDEEDKDLKTQAHTTAAAAHKIALDTLNTQSLILAANLAQCKQTSINEMTACVGAATGSLAECKDFLQQEEQVITSIQNVIRDAKSTGLTQLTTLAHTHLLQSAGRFVNHLIHRHSNGKIKMPALYTTDLSKHADIKDSIIEVLDNMKVSANNSIYAENARTATLHTENAGLRQVLEKAATDALAQCHAEQDTLIADATADRDKWNGECTAATDAFNTASANCDTATVLMSDALQRQIDEIPVAQNTLNNSLVAAQNTFNENSVLALSKKTSSEQYLNEEQATVEEIRTALAGLNKPAVELLQDKSLSSEQLQAVVSLLALSGKYNNDERAGYGGSNHSQAQNIEQLLAEIEHTIATQLEACCGASQDSTCSQDSADIAADKAKADALAQDVFAAEELRLQTDVDVTTADKEQKCSLLPALQAEKESDCGKYAEAAAILTAVTSNAIVARAQCEEAKTNSFSEAEGWFNDRELNVDTDADTEIQRLMNTIASIHQIEEFVNTMTFSAQLLQQKNIDNVPTSYRNEDSSDEKINILAIIAKLKETISGEFTRAEGKYLADNTAINGELSSSNLAATQAKETDIVRLQDKVDSTNATKDSLTQPLLDASEAHAKASKDHNAALDALQTATDIQTQNRPVFDQDLAATTAIASQILGFQKELHNKCALSLDYLTITDEYVVMIQTAAQNVRFDATTTITTGIEVMDKYEGKADQYIADSHTDIKAHFKSIVGTEKARKRSEGVDESDVSTDVADHALSANSGEHTTYDTSGQAARRLMAGSAGNLVEPVKLAESLGDVIQAVRDRVEAERQRVTELCSSQQQAFEAQNVDVMGVATNQFDAQVKEDADRVSNTQATAADTFKLLTHASTAKGDAQLALDNAAAELRDAIETQGRETAVVEAQFDAQTARNEATHTAAQSRIDVSIAAAKKQYNDQKALLDQIEAAVNSGVAQEELLQALTSAMKHVVESRLYDFSTTKSANFEDNASGEYDSNSNISATFDSHTATLSSMVDDLVSRNNDQLAHVAQQAQQDQVDANTTRDDALVAAQSKLDFEVLRLQTDVDNTLAAVKTAQGALDAQDAVLKAAKLDYTNKEGVYQSTFEEGNNKIAIAQQDRIVCVNNKEETRQEEVARYADSLQRALGLLQAETDMVENIRAAMNGEKFDAAPTMATWNSCSTEKQVANAAASQCAETAEACQLLTTKYAGQSMRPGLNACNDQASYECHQRDITKTAFDACNAPAQHQHSELLSEEQLENAFMQLRAKYASVTDMTLDFSAHRAEMDSILETIEAKIAAEKTAAEQQAATDTSSTETKAQLANQACLDAEAAVQEEWNGKIAAALEDMDFALVTRDAEQSTWNGLQSVLAAKTGDYNAAITAQQEEGATAQSLFDSEVSATWTAYDQESALIEDVAATDTDYLNAENDVLAEIILIIAKLGLDDTTPALTQVACVPQEAAECAEDHTPVCGTNGVKYSNACHADSLCVEHSSDMSGCE